MLKQHYKNVLYKMSLKYQRFTNRNNVLSAYQLSLCLKAGVQRRLESQRSLSANSNATQNLPDQL